MMKMKNICSRYVLCNDSIFWGLLCYPMIVAFCKKIENPQKTAEKQIYTLSVKNSND